MVPHLGILFVAAALTACATAPEASLRVEGNRLFFPVEVNGAASEALLDSGAEMTLIDTAFAQQAGLVAFGSEEVKGTGAGTEEVQFAEGVTLAAAGLMLEGQAVAILDLTDISSRVVGHPVAVILGRELFDAGRFELDIARGHLRRVSRETPPRGELLALSDANGIKQVDLRINGRAVKADFDLGNGSEILLSPSFAEAAGLLSPDNIVGTKDGGGIGGPVERTIVRVRTLELAGRVLTDLTAAVSPSEDGADANIGVSVLRGFGLVIDFPENKVWMEARD